MGGIRSTAENLREAISGEHYEFTQMYPPMIDTAKAEGDQTAERVFSYANEVEKIHGALYQKALDSLDTPEQVDSYYVCSVCGYTCENEPPDQCPVCKANIKAFFRGEN